ncbi:MAG: ATP-binding protein [Bdellovibrionales bacterium]|nr:ATP-binding protein [Bdellovibrionales bacterium]
MIDQIPYWQFFKNYMMFTDGSLGIGFKIQGFDISCKSDDEINALASSLDAFLRSLDSTLKYQFYFDANPNVENQIESHKILLDNEDPTLQSINESRIKEFEKKLKQNHFYNIDIYLFSRSLPHRLRPQKLFESFDAFSKTTEKSQGEFYDLILEKFEKLQSSLNSLGFKTEQVESSDWKTLIYKCLNQERFDENPTPLGINSENLFEHSITSKLIVTDHILNKDGIAQGGFHFRFLTLKHVPEPSTYSAMIENLCSLPFHFRLIQNIELMDQDKAKSRLQLKRRVAHSMVSGSQNLSDIESETSFQSIEDLLRDLSNGSEKLITFDLTIVLWGSSEKMLEQKVDEAIKAVRSMNSAEVVLETYGSMDAFIKTLPGVCEGFRKKVIKTSNLSHLLPVYEPWRGNNSALCLTTSRENSLFGLNPFEPTLPSWNGIVFGGSGSGKSFTVSQLMLMFYSTNLKPKIVWIDNGASSKQVVECLGGEFLDLSTESSFSLNLFDLPEGEKMPTPEKVKLILAVLEIIFKDEETKFLPKREKALLEEAIFNLYDKYDTPKLSHLREVLRQSSSNELKKYSDILFSWTGETAYGKILDRESNITLKKDITSIEMQSLNKHPELKDALLLLLTSYIQDLSTGDFSKKYLLIIDEAERLFKTEMAKEFAITCYRTWRKFNSAVWSLSQNYKDFLSSEEIKDSLLPNVNNLIILRQRKIDWSHFQKTFDFNDTQVTAIKSLEISKGKFSEFYYQQGDKDIVLKIEPDPLSYWICTTDPLDKMKISECVEKNSGKSLIECLEILVRESTHA